MSTSHRDAPPLPWQSASKATRPTTNMDSDAGTVVPTRESSADSSSSSSTSSSALSNIELAATALLDNSSRAGSSESTPPTSLPDTTGTNDSAQKDGGAGGRSRRVRAGVPGSYNLKRLSDAQFEGADEAGSRSRAGRQSRDVSGLTGRTLVEGQEEAVVVEGLVKRRRSVKERAKKVAGKVGSLLGKRGREAVDAGKKKLAGKKRARSEEFAEEAEAEEGLPRWKKELDTGPKGLLDEIDLDAPIKPPPAKKSKLQKEVLREMAQPPAAPPPLVKAVAAAKRMKRWEKEGLYVGQEATSTGSKKLAKKRPASSAPNAESLQSPNKAFLPLPMFAYLDKYRPFTIPYDVFAPSWKKGDEKPRDWHALNRNRLVGEAKDLWEKSERLPASMCVCSAPAADSGELGCDETCLNRVMQYECNDENCNLSASVCGNRAFAELTTRMKKGGPYDVGVEVLKTPNRGFGVRSCRTWAPGQIIMEYTGEIVSEGECQRRMREEYKDKQCYYLMELERGLIIDGTKGSMARFINHSCEPNCEVRMVKVNGTPRMGVFAGEAGVATGEELTYDYNFDNFGKSQQQCFCGAETCRGFLSKRLNKEEQKRILKVEAEKKRKAEDEAMRHAAEDERRKKAKTDRGSGWRGWVSVDDPETRARLKVEKREREEREKGSDRARRLAARMMGGVPKPWEEERKKAMLKRKRLGTPAVAEEAVKEEVDADDEAVAGAADEAVEDAVTVSAPTTSDQAPEEGVTRSTSVHSTATITRKTEISITSTTTEVHMTTSAEQEPAPGGEGIVATKLKRSSSIRDAVKSVGQAVKNGLLGAGDEVDGKKKGSVGGSNGKLKQSTLSFAKLS